MEEHTRVNGTYKTELQSIRRDVEFLRQNFASPVKELTLAIHELTIKLDSFIECQKNTLQLKVVAWMFFILVLGMVGVEGADYIFKHFLPLVK